MVSKKQIRTCTKVNYVSTSGINGVNDDCHLKKAGCKNVIFNKILFDNQICIVKSPIECPRSSPRIFWKINKTLYGLTRFVHHWYTKISNHLKDGMEFVAMAQANMFINMLRLRNNHLYMLDYMLTILCIIPSQIKLNNGWKII